jgi:PAS domain S-box-containing protein
MFARLTGRLTSRFPEWLLRYAAAVLSLALLTALTLLVAPLFGRAHPVLSAYLMAFYAVVILGAAWLGYGPGILVCFLVAFVVPLFTQRRSRSLSAELLIFGVELFVALLVSTIAHVRRRLEAELRRAAEVLEARVLQRTEEALRAVERAREAVDNVREQAQLLDLAHDAILSIDMTGAIRFWNSGAERMYGWKREEVLGQISRVLLQTQFPEPQASLEAKLLSCGHWEGEMVHTRRDGSQLCVASRWALRRVDGEARGFLEINTDITERRRVEEQLRHTQKLESLGVLAGGVAHDFNNLLTGILGNASLVLDSIPAHHSNHMLMEDLMKAAERAADLTRQLLAYAGKGRFVLRTVDLSALVREIAGLIQASIPKHVQIRLQLDEDLAGIDADPGQIQQIVMNLTINGAEAIAAEGGAVLVRTGTQQVDKQYINTMSSAGELLQPGEYVCLEIHDTGCGMTEDTLSRIFDPFFTTKFTGRGLGLSAVLGIVRAHRGALKVYSKPGQGTSFKVLFPASANAVREEAQPAKGDLAGRGTVLVVDDEEVVRQIAKNTLERYGYTVLTAANGQAAVDLYRPQPQAIDAVLLDLTMPVMNGEETLRQLQTIYPQVRVLLTSGYSEVEAVQRFAGKGLAGFIQKPYTASGLAGKVKETLAQVRGLGAT